MGALFLIAFLAVGLAGLGLSLTQTRAFIDSDSSLLIGRVGNQGRRRKSVDSTTASSTDGTGCTEMQCQSCSECLAEKIQEPGCNPGSDGQCIDPDAKIKGKCSGCPPGEKKCYKALQDCGDNGRKECMHLLMCNHPCICLDWKQSECSNPYSHEPSQCELLSMLEKTSRSQKNITIGAKSDSLRQHLPHRSATALEPMVDPSGPMSNTSSGAVGFEVKQNGELERLSLQERLKQNGDVARLDGSAQGKCAA